MRRLLVALVLLEAIVSCTADIGSSESGRLRIKIAETTGSEGIEKMDIFIFNDFGDLEASTSVNLGKNLKSAETNLSVRTGIKDVYILANMDSPLGSISSVGELMSERISMGERGFSEGLLPMGGSVKGVEVVANKNNSCSASLQRFPSRIHIGSVTNEMECSLNDVRFRLSNAAGDCAVSKESEPSLWFNKNYSLGSDIKAPEDIVLDREIKGGEKRTVDECLFCFPNHTERDSFSGSTFSPRKTRLVMSGLISGKIYYYPITFDSIDRNTSYFVNIVIRNLGSPDPETPSTYEDLSVSIVPISWSGPLKIEESL